MERNFCFLLGNEFSFPGNKNSFPGYYTAWPCPTTRFFQYLQATGCHRCWCSMLRIWGPNHEECWQECTSRAPDGDGIIFASAHGVSDVDQSRCPRRNTSGEDSGSLEWNFGWNLLTHLNRKNCSTTSARQSTTVEVRQLLQS